jgi:hypothetical protein
MARTMKKFSAGGAQGRYDRRMADIDKDFKKNSAGKSGKALEVLEAKRMQRTADAKDDLAKRTGADRTATRAAERAAESNLTKTRKYGAPKAVTTEASVSEPKVATVSAPLKSGLATSAKKAPAKVAAKSPAKPDINNPSMSSTRAKLEGNRADFRRQQLNRRKINAAAEKEPVTKFDKAAFSDLKTGKNSYGAARIGKTGDTKGTGTSRLARAADPKDTSSAASRARFGAAMSYLNPFSYIENRARRQDPSEVNKAKGGKVTKGKTMKKPAKAKAKPFAATKFGAAMVKKSADTKGRAMMKKAGGGKCYAKGGSIDGIAKKGKTKATMVKMARGGSALMRSRDSYGGANFKKGGKC